MVALTLKRVQGVQAACRAAIAKAEAAAAAEAPSTAVVLAGCVHSSLLLKFCFSTSYLVLKRQNGVDCYTVYLHWWEELREQGQRMYLHVYVRYSC